MAWKDTIDVDWKRGYIEDDLRMNVAVMKILNSLRKDFYMEVVLVDIGETNKSIIEVRTHLKGAQCDFHKIIGCDYKKKYCRHKINLKKEFSF
jgi:hypothetical protein